ncbi:hypothetical protein P153DRAFT_429266 [Dothidotthia symphoricarpi CBS 119687]|uniref:TPR-like protein n=1 Tax=Dothidotthia symphoricarpi CBS 119687 TaxID=1392245 RepID=A0A6A6ALV8_9PLEO|nr:uncharacterized protein P153DRAFT_429266 [Dothidotthia symphoricarpi CBS 119687]KAF2132065.1 hypothetical protein P153DRAFT_429266 [Dothidotthia symphoricarpi CBS 119687]
MPPKKSLLKPKPKSKTKAPDPQSENDFLDTADEHEQAAGKWRAGDAAKAARFFTRALDVYNAGLARYPRSFDLAYNKAVLEFNITEDPRIVAHLGNNRNALLEATLVSHRNAISLNPTNTDILFNAAQVLTSLAEARLDAGPLDTARLPARMLLEESVDLFTKCLDSQEREYAQMQDEIAKAQASGEYQEAWGGERPAKAQEQEEEEADETEVPEEWAIVEEPLTPESILETCTAQLGALTTLLGLYSPADLASIEKKAQDGLETANSKIPALIDLVDKFPSLDVVDEPKAGPTLSIGSAAATEEATTSPKEDAVLAAANFHASIAEAMYRSGRTTSTEYAQTVESTFSSLTKGTATTTDLAFINIQSAYADALMDLSSALADGTQYTPSFPTFSTDIEIQWTALTQVQTILTKLSSAPQSSFLSPSRLADVFLARGDVDLFRFRMSLFEAAKPAWVKSRTVLVTNAGVFYRGARSYAERAGTSGVRGVADAKAIVAEILKEVANGSGAKKEHWKGRSADVARVVEQMAEEGIVGRENVEGVLKWTT